MMTNSRMGGDRWNKQRVNNKEKTSDSKIKQLAELKHFQLSSVKELKRQLILQTAIVWFV